jgi:hypothetical protein
MCNVPLLAFGGGKLPSIRILASCGRNGSNGCFSVIGIFLRILDFYAKGKLFF